MNPWRIAGWGLGATILILPLVAMQFTNEVNWSAFDFLFATVLILAVGIPLELTVRFARNSAYRAGVAVALVAAFLTVWVNGAVGMIGDEGNPYNLLFGGVLFVAIVGTIIALFKPAGMALAMYVAALAQLLAAGGGLFTDLRGGMFSMGFALLWLVSGRLFQKAADDNAVASEAR